MKKAGNKKKNNKEFKYISTKLYCLLMLVMVSVFGVSICSRYINRCAVEEEVAILNEELSQKQKIYADYEKQLEQMYTDENIEKRARDIGLVKDGEIIYIINEK